MPLIRHDEAVFGGKDDEQPITGIMERGHYGAGPVTLEAAIEAGR